MVLRNTVAFSGVKKHRCLFATHASLAACKALHALPGLDTGRTMGASRRRTGGKSTMPSTHATNATFHELDFGSASVVGACGESTVINTHVSLASLQELNLVCAAFEATSNRSTMLDTHVWNTSFLDSK